MWADRNIESGYQEKLNLGIAVLVQWLPAAVVPEEAKPAMRVTSMAEGKPDLIPFSPREVCSGVRA